VDEAMRTGVRVVRATLTAGTVLALAAGAHRLGGGMLPPPAALVAVGSVVLLVTTFLSRWNLSLAALLPVLGAAEYALHHVLGLLSVSGQALPARGMHDAMSAIAFQDATGTPMNGMTASMTAAHVAATVATAIVLVGGDRAARMALHWWSSRLPLVHGYRRTPAIRVRHLIPVPVARVGRPCAALRRSDPRRGPPLSFA
jgi:hypothetical protein